MKIYLIDNCKKEILGKDCIEWLKEGLKDGILIDSKNQIVFDYDYTCLVYSDTPNITNSHITEAVDFIEKNALDGLSIGEGFIFKGMKMKSSKNFEYEVKVTKITNLESYMTIKEEIKLRILNKLFDGGVIILDSRNIEIDANAEIGSGSVIYPFNKIDGKTVVGKNCRLYSYNDLHNCIIGDNTEVRSTYAVDCQIGENCTLGPFACIRKDSIIGDGCRIGDFVEVKKSTLEKGVKCAHLSYIGDAFVGEKTNIGCGTVFANYNGKIKQKTEVGKNVFIGCNSNLIAPLKIENEAYIAAGSTVTEDVPEKTMCIARCRQTLKRHPSLKENN